MRLSGFSFVRNGVLYGYPFLESIRSALPLCDEFVVAVGNSDDETLERIEGLHEPKIRIIRSVWDESIRQGGTILAQQTNLALDHVTGDWALYVQADEILHERDYSTILQTVAQYDSNPMVEGFLFDYKHFYGSYSFLGASRRWYRHEIRIVRTGIGVRSWGDAQGFRLGGRKLRVKKIDASIYHYGWVKSPRQQQAKQETFNRYWHDDEWVRKHVRDVDEYDYHSGGRLVPFRGTHPSVMAGLVKNQDWEFRYDPRTVHEPLGERILDWFEDKTGIRIGEYKNYRLL